MAPPRRTELDKLVESVTLNPDRLALFRRLDGLLDQVAAGASSVEVRAGSERGRMAWRVYLTRRTLHRIE